MTVGLAVYNNDGIYMAIESVGTKLSTTVGKKLLQIQSVPEFYLMMAGGTEHWKSLVDQYQSQPTLEDAAKFLKAVFDRELTPKNQIFAFLFAYENSKPRYIYVEREVSASETSIDATRQWKAEEVLHIGTYGEAKTEAEKAIGNKVDMSVALRTAIETLVAQGRHWAEAPVISEKLKP
jgi:hypothetical protein